MQVNSRGWTAKKNIAGFIAGFNDAVHHALLRLYVAQDYITILDMNVGVTKLMQSINSYFPENWLIDVNNQCETMALTMVNPEETVGTQLGSWGVSLKPALEHIISEIHKYEAVLDEETKLAV